MRKPHEKYIPFICLTLMFLISWLSESYIYEGKWNHYLYEARHVIIRSFLRVLNVIIIFVLGNIAIKTLNIKWVKLVWFFWYSVAFSTAVISKLPSVFFNQEFSNNTKDFLIGFYGASFSPFPFMFLWFLAVIAKRKYDSKQ